MDYEYLNKEFKKYCEEKKDSILKKKLLRVLNSDRVRIIKLENNVVYPETLSYLSLPNYFYNEIKNFCKQKGYFFYGDFFK